MYETHCINFKHKKNFWSKSKSSRPLFKFFLHHFASQANTRALLSTTENQICSHANGLTPDTNLDTLANLTGISFVTGLLSVLTSAIFIFRFCSLSFFYRNFVFWCISLCLRQFWNGHSKKYSRWSNRFKKISCFGQFLIFSENLSIAIIF